MREKSLLSSIVHINKWWILFTVGSDSSAHGHQHHQGEGGGGDRGDCGAGGLEVVHHSGDVEGVGVPQVPLQHDVVRVVRVLLLPQGGRGAAAETWQQGVTRILS